MSQTSSPAATVDASAKIIAEKIAGAFPRALSEFEAAVAAVTEVVKRRKADIECAFHSRAKAEALFSDAPTPAKSQKGEDGTLFELYDGGVQMQRKPDGARVVVFSDEKQSKNIAGHFPKSESDNVRIQVGTEEDKVVCQFVAGTTGDLAVMSKSGDALQVLMSEGGVLACKLCNDNMVQASLMKAASSNIKDKSENAALDVIQNFLLKPEDFQTVLRFGKSNESILEELRGCTFSIPSDEHGKGVLHHTESSEVAQSHWSDERVVCVFRNGLICERRASGEVLVMQSLDTEVQDAIISAANSKSKGDTTGNTEKSEANLTRQCQILEDIDFNSQDRVELAKKLKEKQLFMMNSKQTAVDTLTSAQVFCNDALTLRAQADKLRHLGGLVREYAKPLGDAPLLDAQQAVKQGLIRQESTDTDGTITTVLQMSDGTRIQRQRFAKPNSANWEEGQTCETATSVMLVPSSKPVTDCPDLENAIYQQRTFANADKIQESRSIVVLSNNSKIVQQVGDGDDTNVIQISVVMNDKIDPTSSANDSEPSRVQYRIAAESGDIDVLTVIMGKDAPVVQIMPKSVPERLVCVYENHDSLQHVQISDKTAAAAGVIMLKNGCSHQLSQDGSFTIQISAGKQNATSEAMQLTPDDSLIVAKSDGTQWKWTGTELLSLQLPSGNSPRAKLHNARSTDAMINNGE